jgi:ribosome-binding factor A
MALDKRTRENMRAHCGEIHPDDGIDPQEFFKIDRNRGKSNHRASQLCRQVAETLDLVLSGEIHDDILQGLRVASVAPAPDTSRLLVALHCDLPPEQFDRREVESRLAQHTGQLRYAVAASITRRKTPTLSFVVIGPSPIGEDAP